MIYLLSALLFLSGCASAPLTESEKSVRILRKSDAPKECKEVGKVSVGPYQTITPEAKDDNLKREASKLGGNVVTDDGNTANGVAAYGTAFKCN